jgi:hypothetical protein
MSSLSSSPPHGLTTDVFLSGAPNFNAFRKFIHTHAKTNGGRIGQNLIDIDPKATIILRKPKPGQKPSAFDLRQNPHTQKAAVPNAPEYPRDAPILLDKNGKPDTNTTRPPTMEEIYNSPMTEKAFIAYKQDLKAYNDDLKAHNDEREGLRAHDDSVYTFMLLHVTPPAQALIATLDAYKSLDDDPLYFYRSRDYLALATHQFATGDSFLATNNLITMLNTFQGTQPFATHVDTLESNWPQVSGSLEDEKMPGYVRLDSIKFMILLQTINRNSPANKQAVNTYFTNRPSTKDIDSSALITELVKQNQGSLAQFSTPDPASEQDSALLSTTTYGAKIAGQEHCKNCFAATKNATKSFGGTTYTGPFYFYHEKCKRKAASKERSAASAASALAAQADTNSLHEMIMAVLANQQYDQQHRQSADTVSVVSAPTNPQQP